MILKGFGEGDFYRVATRKGGGCGKGGKELGAEEFGSGHFRGRGRGDCDAGAFFEGVDFIYAAVVEFFGEAAGPADFDGVEFCGGTEAEVDAHVVVGIVAGAAADFVDEGAGAGFEGHAGAEGGKRGGKGTRGGKG